MSRKKKAVAAAPVAAAPTPVVDRSRTILFVLLAVSLLLSVLFALRVPLDGNPDEKAHLDYIRLIVENRGFVPFIKGDPTRYEVHQPPLYYLLCVPVWAASGGGFVAVRLVAALIQLATIGLVFRACRDLFPKQPEVVFGAAAFATFLPVQAQLGGSINNDPLTTLLCAGVFWRLGRLLRDGQTVRESVLLGAIFGAGLLTKLSVLQLVPAILLAYFVAVRAKTIDPKPAAIRLATALALGVLIASPWLVRNVFLYGDPLALRIYRDTGPNYTPQQLIDAGVFPSMGDYLSTVFTRTFATFWFFLPPDKIKPGPIPILIVAVLGLGGLFGTLRWLRERIGDAATAAERRVIGVFVAAIFLLMPFFFQFILVTFQAQGRYFLPVLLPVAVVAVVGWDAILRRGHLLVVSALLVLTLMALSGAPFHAVR